MYSINCRGKLLSLQKPLVMGIINVTDDSFYKESRNTSVNEALIGIETLINEGADIIDIGGQSTRPGSIRYSAEEELIKIRPVIKEAVKNFPNAVFSVDTYHAQVAEETVELGIAIVNDISAGNMDDNMLHTVANLKVPFICMHSKGKPETMHLNPEYENITREILEFFIAKVNTCSEEGIVDLILDPGFGFGKTIAHNFELLKNLEAFKVLNKPIMVGLSRKSLIYKTFGNTAADALNGTSVLNTIALLKGASILRVHDVPEAKQAVLLAQKSG